jgi:hypothetical protein
MMPIGRIVAAIALVASTGQAAVAALGPRDFLITGATLPGYWTPSKAEAAEAKAAMLTFLSAPHPEVPVLPDADRRAILTDIASSYLQFEGVSMLRDGDQVKPDPAGSRNVRIFGACRVSAPELTALRKGFGIMAMDGGPCYFKAYYDLTAKRIWLFEANGRG